jgi:N-methylhydantoinase A
VSVGSPFQSVEDAVRDFEQAHLREYNYTREGASLEIFRLNVTAIGVTPKAELKRFARSEKRVDPAATRRVVFDDVTRPLATPVYRRDRLPAGFTVEGPCIVEQLDSTSLVPPAATMSVDEWLNLRISV